MSDPNPPHLGPWGQPSDPPPTARPFKVEVGLPLAPFAQPFLHEATIEQLNNELTRRFQGVALVGIQIVQVGPQSPSGAMECVARDMYYTSVRGIPFPALAGCLLKLAADLQARATPIDIKPA